MLRTITLIGRPNVGKSTLFNRLAGDKRSIVHPQPGVTRDWMSDEVVLDGISIRLLDTGGIVTPHGTPSHGAPSHNQEEDLDSDDPFASGIQDQTNMAIEQADGLIVMSEAGVLLPEDYLIAKRVREGDKPCLWIVNKVDGREQESALYSVYELGIKGPVLGISAAHGYGMRDFREALQSFVLSIFPKTPNTETASPHESDPDAVPASFAILGCPNSGKSTLFNRFLGFDRALVSSIPGTTRDSLDEAFLWNKKAFCVVDTAGIRRRMRIDTELERAAAGQSLATIRRSPLVILMIDAQRLDAVAEQDKKIASVAVRNGRGLIIALNKIDGLDRHKIDEIIDRVLYRFAMAHFVPVIPISAKEGTGLGRLLKKVSEIHSEYGKRIQTRELTRILGEAWGRHDPSGEHSQVRLHYAQQVYASPPHFVLMTNKPWKITQSYNQYLENCIRRAFGFEGIPIKITIRGGGEKGRNTFNDAT